jgi:hypothetical protein
MLSEADSYKRTCAAPSKNGTKSGLHGLLSLSVPIFNGLRIGSPNGKDSLSQGNSPSSRMPIPTTSPTMTPHRRLKLAHTDRIRHHLLETMLRQSLEGEFTQYFFQSDLDLRCWISAAKHHVQDAPPTRVGHERHAVGR